MIRKKPKIVTLSVLLIVLSLLLSNTYASNDSLRSSEFQNNSISKLDIVSKPILKDLDLSKLKSEIIKSNEDLKSESDMQMSSSHDKISANRDSSSNSLFSTAAYTPFINFLDQQFANMANTPGNTSVTDTFLSIKQNNPTIDYSSNYAIDSAYILSTTINGVRQDFYAMEIVYPVSLFPGSPILEDHGIIIYNQNYKSHPLYNTGRYKKGFNDIRYGSGESNNCLTIRAGIVDAYVPIIAYKDTAFGDYRKFYLYDFFNPSISLELGGGYDPSGVRPYFVSWVSCGNRIIYGRAAWYSDGSGSNELYRIDRILGNQISNNNILFWSNNEFEIGTALTFDTYTFYSTIGDGKTYLIDLNTLQYN